MSENSNAVPSPPTDEDKTGTFQPVTLDEHNPRQRFKELACTWKEETLFLSSITDKATHPAYQQIIGMGKDAIPFILNDLADTGPNDWYWALTAITDVNPIHPEMAGNMVAMTEAWLQWGTQAGYRNTTPTAQFASLRERDKCLMRGNVA